MAGTGRIDAPLVMTNGIKAKSSTIKMQHNIGSSSNRSTDSTFDPHNLVIIIRQDFADTDKLNPAILNFEDAVTETRSCDSEI